MVLAACTPSSSRIYLMDIFLCLFYVRLAAVRHVLDNWKSRWLPMDKQNNLFTYFSSKINLYISLIPVT